MPGSENEVFMVRVLYDFEYQANDSRWIWMKEGERLAVVKQVNDDWWQVMRNSEKVTFYAPASYLESCECDDIEESTSHSDRKESLSGEHLDSGIADVSGGILNEDQGASSSDCNIDELGVDYDHFKAEDDDSPSSATYHNPIYSNFKFPTLKVDVPLDNTKNDLSEISNKSNLETNKNVSVNIIFLFLNFVFLVNLK